MALLLAVGCVAGAGAVDCSVLSFGAKCDGATDDTKAIQSAIDQCAYRVLEFPPGGTCLSFPLNFHNGTALYLPPTATLKAFPDVGRWPNATMFNFVELRHKRDIAVFGSGTIDGSGEQWWVINVTARPRLFHMSNIHNVSFRDVLLTNTGAMTLAFGSPCSDALVDGVRILNPAVGNTDGIDMGCDGALIQNTRVINGDDSICMKSAAKNVVVRNCSVHNGKPYPTSVVQGLAGGLVLGTSDEDSMENVTFSNCTVVEALAGIRIKFRPTQTGSVRGVRFEGIRVERPAAYAVDVLLTSNHIQHHHNLSTVNVSTSNHIQRHHNLSTVSVSDVSITDTSGFLADDSRAVARFACTSESPCSGLVLTRFNITGFKASAKYPQPCTFEHVTGSGTQVTPSQCTPPAPV
eukprot:Hpha_TRINITY_DN27096_c0_g1::TRINITY_DN27096_c0_g1_i1::g.33292::m.33292